MGRLSLYSVELYSLEEKSKVGMEGEEVDLAGGRGEGEDEYGILIGENKNHKSSILSLELIGGLGMMRGAVVIASAVSIEMGVRKRKGLRVLFDVSLLILQLLGEGRDLRAFSFLYKMGVADVPAVNFVLLLLNVDTHKAPFYHLLI